MKKTFLLIIIFIACFNTMLYAEDLYYPGHEHLYKNQWGALEDILNDLKSKTISTDECMIYGCYVLAANEPSNPDKDKKAKLIPKKYDLNKKSKEDGPSFFVYYLYKFDEYAGKEARLEFKQSDWSDQEFIDEYTNNDAFIKIINNMQPQIENEKKYIHCCDVIEKATHDNVLYFDTLNFRSFTLLGYQGYKRYYDKIQPFEKKHNFDCYGHGKNCHNDIKEHRYYLLKKYEETFPKIPNNIERKRKLINTINYYYYCTCHHNELKDK